MSEEETKHWTFHHLGVVVNDLKKAVEYYKSLGIVTFPPLPPAAKKRGQAGPIWLEMSAYGKTVIRDGEPVDPPAEITKHGLAVLCHMGTIQLELIQCGDAFRDVNLDFLETRGEGISHIAYIVNHEHYGQEVEKMKAKGLRVLYCGRKSNGDGFTYFDTRKVGGIITELMGA